MRTDSQSTEAEKIFNEIRKKIISGEIQPGQRLVETQIASQFNVSRTPARLAIERLVAFGFVDHEPNKGATVHKFSFEEIRELLYIRQNNEALVAGLAAAKCKDTEALTLYAIVKKMQEVLTKGDIKSYTELSTDLHLQIMKIADNNFLTDFVMSIYLITSPYHMSISSLPHRAEQSFVEHKKVVDAIVANDQEKAKNAMFDHISVISNFFNDDYSRVYYNLRNVIIDNV